MKRYLKRAGALALAIALSGSATACGGNEGAVQLLDGAETQPEYLSFFSSNEYSGSDVGKYWSDRFADVYDKEVYVNYDGASYYAAEGMSYRELLEKRMQSSQPDDLYVINAEDVLDFKKKGYWLDLSGLNFVENLSDAALYQSTYAGEVFSVPLSFTGFGFYWNADLLQEHDLTVPENLDEFLTVCEKLKAGGVLPYGANKGYALTVPAMCTGLAELYQSADRDRKIEELNRGTSPISTYMRDGFEFLKLLIDKGYLDPAQAMATTPGSELELFQQGGCAFFCGSLGAVPLDAENGWPHVVLTGLPVLPEGSVAVYGTDERLCVNPQSKHLESALEFIEMVGTTEALNQSAFLAHAMSTAKNSTVAVPPGQQELRQLLQSPGQIPNQDFALHFNTWESIRDIGREICGGLSVDEACDKLDALQQAELAAYAGNGK